MRIAICEDNTDEMKYLANLILYWSNIRKVNIDLVCYCSAENFLFSWPDMVVDIIFLDIKLKQMSGIDLAEKIRKNDKEVLIIFITNYEQYSLKGYDVDALNFLIKPISETKLISVLDKAYKIWYGRERDVIIVTNNSAQIKLFCGNIYFINMNSHIAEIHTETETFRIRRTVDEVIKLFPIYFVRCHRSHIVNLLKVDCMYKNYALLSNGEKIPISRNYSRHVNDTFLELFKE